MNDHLLTLNAARNPITINLAETKEAAMVFRALNHKLRQQMLKLIDQKGKISVIDLFCTLRLEQSVASQHLAILRRAGFVITEGAGKFVYYSINADRIAKMNKIVAEINFP